MLSLSAARAAFLATCATVSAAPAAEPTWAPLAAPVAMALGGPPDAFDLVYRLEPTDAPGRSTARIEGKAYATHASHGTGVLLRIYLTEATQDGASAGGPAPFATLALNLEPSGRARGSHLYVVGIGNERDAPAGWLRRHALHLGEGLSTGPLRYVAATARQGEPLVDLSPFASAWIAAMVPGVRQVQAFAPAVVRGGGEEAGRPVVDVAVNDRLWVETEQGNANLAVVGYSRLDRATGLPLETVLRFAGPVTGPAGSVSIDYRLQINLTPRR